MQHALAIACLALWVCCSPAAAQTLYVAPDVPADPDGTLLMPWEVVRCDPSGAGGYAVQTTLPGDAAVGGLHKMDAAGSWLFSVEAPNDLAGLVSAPVPGDLAEPRDVILDDGSGTFVKFLCGAALGVPLPEGVGIDAVYLDGGDTDDLILSFDVPLEHPPTSGTVYAAADLVRWSRTDPADCGDWTVAGLELDAATAGLPAEANVIGADRVGAAYVLSLEAPQDLTPACSPATTCMPGQIVSLDSGTFSMFKDLQTVGTPGWSASDLVHALSCEANPGTVYDASALPTGLVLGKAPAGNLELSWPGGSCSSGANDYGIYEGTLTALAGGSYDHVGVDCSDAGLDRTETIAPGTNDRYYLVVPQNGKVEGSYSTDSAGLARPQAPSVADRCLAERVEIACP